MKSFIFSILALAAIAQEQSGSEAQQQAEQENPEAVDQVSQSIADNSNVQQEDIQSALEETGQSDFANLAAKYFDAKTLNGAEEFTLFLPTDDAFASYFEENTEELIDVARILSYHGTAKYVDPAELEGSMVYETLLTKEESEEALVFIVSKEGEEVSVSYGLGSAKVTDSKVIEEGKSVIHIIDTVLEIPQSVSETAKEAELSSLVEALSAADLVETVDQAKAITVFAPNNEAFEAAGEIPEDQLEAALTYHVVGEVLYSTDLETKQYPTLEGTELTVEVDGEGKVTVNGASVLQADVLAENGVVHVIDQVLNVEEGPSPVNESASAASTVQVGLGVAAVAAIVF